MWLDVYWKLQGVLDNLLISNFFFFFKTKNKKNWNLYTKARERDRIIFPFFSIFRRNGGSLLGINISRRKIEGKISPFVLSRIGFAGRRWIEEQSLNTQKLALSILLLTLFLLKMRYLYGIVFDAISFELYLRIS